MSEDVKVKVLYLDDEENNLISFKASYRFEYKIFTAIDADSAIEILSQNPDITVLFSDQRMPGMTGVEFFESIRFRFPKPVRILLTGYTDIEDVINAINKGHIFRYVRKPWHDADITSAIEEAQKYYTTHSKLEEQNESLKKAYAELDKFTYRISHDLKGPIINAATALDMIRIEKNEESRNEIVDLLKSSMIKLENFVENLFEYYKLRHGENSISSIDFKQLVNAQLDIMGVSLKLAGIKVETNIEQTSQFNSDEIKCSIIISNLLSNAIKYQIKDNPEKKISIEIKVNDGNVSMKFHDNGIGIEPEFLKNIFDLFYRATTDEPGSGIGLYNVKDAVVKLNGKIDVVSEPGKGSIFTVNIPGKM